MLGVYYVTEELAMSVSRICRTGGCCGSKSAYSSHSKLILQHTPKTIEDPRGSTIDFGRRLYVSKRPRCRELR